MQMVAVTEQLEEAGRHSGLQMQALADLQAELEQKQSELEESHSELEQLQALNTVLQEDCSYQELMLRTEQAHNLELSKSLCAVRHHAFGNDSDHSWAAALVTAM